MVFEWEYERAKALGLANCPCCDGKAVIRKIGNEHCKKICCEVECTVCHLTRKQCLITKFGRITYDQLQASVIGDWNSRPEVTRLSATLDHAIDQISAHLVHGEVSREGWQLTLDELVAAQQKQED